MKKKTPTFNRKAPSILGSPDGGGGDICITEDLKCIVQSPPPPPPSSSVSKPVCNCRCNAFVLDNATGIYCLNLPWLKFFLFKLYVHSMDT